MARSPFEPDDRIPAIAATRYFTNREGGLQSFARAVGTASGEPLRALVFYGVGGIGKSALLHRLRETLPDGLPAALVDLQTVGDRTRAYREVLLKLRTHLGGGRLDFPRFDLCLGVMLAHEGEAPPPLVRVDPKLSATFKFVYEMVKVVPVVGPAASLLQMATGWAASFPAFQDFVQRAGGMEEIIELRRRAARDDPGLPAELVKRFAWDLSERLPRGGGCRGVVFLDTYEHLWAGRDSSTAQARLLDWWVRDLVRYCVDPAVGVLPVIAGRDRLRWEDEDGDPAWAQRLDQTLLGGLSAEDAQTFLARCGIGKPMGEPASALQAAIIQCCDMAQGPDVGCHPLYLALCADIAINTRQTTGQDPAPATFAGIPTPRLAAELAARFLTSLHSSAVELWVTDLSLTPRFDEDAALALAQARRHAVGRADWERLKGFSFLDPEPDGLFSMHAIMRAVLRSRVKDDAAGTVHEWFEAFWTARREPALAWFHQWAIAPADALVQWKALHDDALKQLHIEEARELLARWSEIALDETARSALGDELWATAHATLAEALTATPLAPRQDALAAAIGHLQSSLLVFARTNRREAWASTQTNLGVAYAALPTGDTEANLRRAIGCYEAALEVYTPTASPRDWANVHNNLGVTYSHLSTGDRAANLRAAVAHYEAALEVCSEDDVPEQWAMLQNNLGTAYRDLPFGDRAHNLREAITRFEAALRVHTETAWPLNWAMIQSNLALTYGALPTGEQTEDLRRAIEHINAALRVYTETDLPAEWASSHNNLALAHLALPAVDRPEHVRRAIESLHAAQRVFTEADFPHEWAVIENNLGAAHRDLPDGDRESNLRQALAHHRAALRVQTETADPEAWAETQVGLSLTLLALGELTGDLEMIRAARDGAAAAQRAYASVGLDQEAGGAAEVLASIEATLTR